MERYICISYKGNRFQFCKIIDYIKDGLPGEFIQLAVKETFILEGKDAQGVSVGTIKCITKSLN